MDIAHHYAIDVEVRGTWLKFGSFAGANLPMPGAAAQPRRV